MYIFHKIYVHFHKDSFALMKNIIEKLYNDASILHTHARAKTEIVLIYLETPKSKFTMN